MSIAPGVVLDSKYLVGRVIGEGAFGVVYEAKNLELDETVALKAMRPEAAQDKALVARFAREAKAAAAIKSEYVASVYDVGSAKNGPPFIVMEYLEGQDLGTVVEKQGPFPARLAVEYALQICEALAVAHSKGIVHRDIKPENLLLCERAGGMRIVKVLDFGISKAALTGSIFGGDIPIVKTVNLVGTPLYMSPEQVRCTTNIDVRSDIWSLGMVLYEILAGATAFSGESITEICASIIENPPKPIEMFRNDLPAGLVDVVYRCLEKDISKRFPNVAELAVALMPFGPKRSRLNVERAVAVLKASGQVNANFEVMDSAYPPSSDGAQDSERMLRDSLGAGRSSSNPKLPSSATASGSTQTIDSPSKPPIDPASFSVHEAPTAKAKRPDAGTATLASKPPPASASIAPPPKSRPTALILGIVAIVAVVAGAAFVLRPMLSNRAVANAAPPPPATTAAVVTPPATTAPPATAEPAPSGSTEVAPAVAQPATTNGKPPAFTPAKAGAVQPFVRPKTPATPPTTTAPAATTTATAATPPPATTAAPAETGTGRTFRRGL